MLKVKIYAIGRQKGRIKVKVKRQKEKSSIEGQKPC